jgi:hypothetical protein
MPGTQTLFVDLARLERQGPDAHLIILLMRAADDIAVANWGLRQFSDSQPTGVEQQVREGARRYFVRLQCGHLFEGLKLIVGVQKSPVLSSLVARCDEAAQDAFRRLCQYVRGGARRQEFERKIGLIRHKAAFHYDAKLAAAALRSRANRKGSSISTITRGTEINLWRSGVADDVEDTLVCRLLWQIPLSADVRVEADKILEFGAGACRDFLDFVGDISFRYLQDTSTV